MSSVSSKLRSLFLQKTAIKAAAVTATKTSAPPPSTTTVTDHLQNLADQFKIKSIAHRFRKNRIIYKTTVRRLAKAQRFSSIHDILDHQKQYPEITDEHFASRLIVLYGQAKMFDHARQLFDELPELKCPRTAISFNALLSACIASDKPDKVIEIFRELPGKISISLDEISYNTAVKALCELGSLEEAILFLDEMEKNGSKPNIVTFNTILGSLYEIGKMSEAENILSLMEEKGVVPDVRSYNAKLSCMVRENRLSEALNVFRYMKEEKGLEPNHYSYNGLIRGFVNEGNLVEAKKWYESMIESGFVPDFVTFRNLVPFVCLEKDFDFGYDLCVKSIELKRSVSSEVIKTVADGLVEQSKGDKAEELLKLVNLESEEVSEGVSEGSVVITT